MVKYKPSFWEQEYILGKSDFLILGAGLTGSFCAFEVKKKFPKKRVVLVDRAPLPIGASTRNAGFACFGSPSELLADLKTMGEDATFSMVEKRWKGLCNLLKICPANQIAYEPIGGNEIFLKHHKSNVIEVLDQLSYLNRKLQSITGEKEVFYIDNLQKELFSPSVKTIIHNKLEGQLNPGKLMSNIFSQMRRLDIEFYGGLNIQSIEEHEDEIALIADKYILKSKQLIIATNAFTKQFFPNIDLIPQRNQVLLTEPIVNLQWRGNFHLDKGYYYFRNVGKRVLIGGGRHLFARQEQTNKFGVTKNVSNKLTQLLDEVILPKTSYKIESSWSGILATAKDKNPIVERISNRNVLAVRLGGMGVAISNLVAKEAVNLIT